MKIHIMTVGEPKLSYAKQGWEEYLKRLQRYHNVRVTHVADKYAYDATYLRQTAGNAYKIALVIDGGKELSSPELSDFLEKRAIEAREICLMIGGPEGLPTEVINQSDYRWSFGKLTYPHDLAMVILLEALYRASTISAGHPYHKA
jgi:23S rRNA (pseudouridine1915-N3)-methyltransferase